MKNVKITLSGNAGSGKSTIGKILSEELRVTFLSVGEICRKKATSLEMDINQFQEFLKSNPNFDKYMDRHIVEYAKFHREYVLDYRLGFHFLPESFKVLLKVNEETSLNRVAKRSGRDEDFSKQTATEKILLIRNRNELMRRRFINTYGADFNDENNYDLVIDTDTSTPPEIVETIFSNFRFLNP